MQKQLQERLRPVRRKPYLVTGNERIKLPAKWCWDNQVDSMDGLQVYMYLTPDGDLLVSTRNYSKTA